MNKKLQIYLEDRIFKYLQTLSVYSYLYEIKNKEMDFELYFNNVHKEILTDILKFLNTDYTLYIDIFKKYSLIVYKFSKQNAIDYVKFGTSNNKVLFDWWKNNKKYILRDIIEIYLKNKK